MDARLTLNQEEIGFDSLCPRMKLLKAKIDWCLDYDNDPRLKVLVDKMPDMSDARFEQRGSLYFAEKDDCVRFFSYSKPGEGYGGSKFNITLLDGTPKTLIGPLSSNHDAMNAAGFTPSFPVVITDDPKTWERGYTFFAGHATLEWVQNALVTIKQRLELVGSGNPCDSQASGEQLTVIGGNHQTLRIAGKQHQLRWRYAMMLRFLRDGSSSYIKSKEELLEKVNTKTS